MDALARQARPARSHDAEAQRINFSWLLRLRWGAISGQAVTILAVDRWIQSDLPLTPLLSIVGIELITNVACAVWAARRPIVREWMLAVLLALDVGLLTGLLYWSGGRFNPFSSLYLVHIALATVVLRTRLAWALSILSCACFGALFVIPEWRHAGMDHPVEMDHVQMHLQGMWVAFVVAAGFIVYFVSRVTSSLSERDAQLARAQDLAARNEKLASLATLAAGVAHEMATPLSTIAVVARELERRLEAAGREHDVFGDAREDARLIRQQVERCREILVQMAEDAGESTGEAILPIRIGALLHDAKQSLGSHHPIETAIEMAAAGRTIHGPPRALALALRGVLKNACQASREADPVTINVLGDGAFIRIEVRDSGAGMPPDVLARAGEPFFTTKEPGRGMGLGLFLTRAVLDRVGGRFELASEARVGTIATLLIPVECSATIHHTAGASTSVGD